METATRVLSEEHQQILKVANALEAECRLIEAGKQPDKKFFEHAISFIRNYADKFHHAKEEDILFKELCRDTVELHCNPVQQMLYEHESGRSFVKGIEDGLKENNPSKICRSATGYADLIKDHIFKEDNILYPMAERALSQKIKRSMLERFKKAESKKFGKTAIKKYVGFAEGLERKSGREK